MLVVDIQYKKTMSEIEPFVEAHRDHLRKCYDAGMFVVSGRKPDGVGGFIIANLDEISMKKLILQDPFHINDLAVFVIAEFKPTIWCEALNDMLGNP